MPLSYELEVALKYLLNWFENMLTQKMACEYL